MLQRECVLQEQAAALVSEARERVAHPTLSTDWWVLECGGGGDCLFHALGRALGESMLTVRDWAAHGVTVANVDRLLEYYTTIYPVGSWSREDVRSAPDRVAALRAVIRTPGPSYEGDDTTLRLLVSQPDVALAVVVVAGQEVYPQIFANRHSQRLVVLYHRGNHWQLAAWQPEPQCPHLWLQLDPFAPPASLWQALSREAGVADLWEAFGHWEPRLELDGQSPETNVSLF